MMHKQHDPVRVLAGATSIALAALLLLIPATGTPQSEANKSGATLERGRDIGRIVPRSEAFRSTAKFGGELRSGGRS
jgi:hypothetical protein